MQYESIKTEADHSVSPNRLFDANDLPVETNTPEPGVPYLAERAISLEARTYGSVLITMSFALIAWIAVCANDALSVIAT